ncbi:energy transducer TonB [Glaciimonas soli]|uniref:TonB family protein n=1 Tax=Glaciimonas soli TaxID=2590999 RepID=A0A843YN32_9BURK|nr:energy transducer TonB [Glaciimonas soli]MQR01269.1 TonB family protein [Glaciimonas soli]
MSLLDKLLSRAVEPAATQANRVFVRVYLDTAGYVTNVKIKKSCGDPELDEQALREIANMRFPSKRRGEKTSHNWHDLAYTINDL